MDHHFLIQPSTHQEIHTIINRFWHSPVYTGNFPKQSEKVADPTPFTQEKTLADQTFLVQPRLHRIPSESDSSQRGLRKMET